MYLFKCNTLIVFFGQNSNAAYNILFKNVVELYTKHFPLNPAELRKLLLLDSIYSSLFQYIVYDC